MSLTALDSDLIPRRTALRGGLVLYYKRLERGRFRMPQLSADGAYVEMDSTQLAMLLDGSTSNAWRAPSVGRREK